MVLIAEAFFWDVVCSPIEGAVGLELGFFLSFGYSYCVEEELFCFLKVSPCFLFAFCVVQPGDAF